MNSLLEQLLQDGLLKKDQARVVAIECATKQVSPSTVLLQSAFVSQESLQQYSDQSLVVELSAAQFVPDENALALLGESVARRLCALPLSLNLEKNVLVVVLDDLSNVITRDTVRREVHKQYELAFRKASTTDIKQILNKCYGHSDTLSSVLSELDQHTNVFSLDAETVQTPIVRLIETLLQDAIMRRASDIHLSPEQSHIQVRYRIDGVLRNIICLHIRYWPAMLVRIKVLSDLDIAETRLPQDGYLGRNIHGAQIDFRVSSFPLNSGENLVLRVLDRRKGLLELSELCNDADTLARLKQMIKRPSGMVLVCGPTGSGKTTTLYALLRSLDAEALNIMTLEDPVEYSVANIRQTRVNGNSALSFAQGVRGVLRQDPDVILVGEVRDADSCAVSCRAALTGHLVLTSTHANSAVGAIGRLLELGVSRHVLANVLAGVVSQRLFRKLCEQCAGEHDDCRVCFGSGYGGRLALFECFSMTDAFVEQLQCGASLNDLKTLAIEEGMRTLGQQAKALCRQGLTSNQEVERVLGEQP